MKLAELSAGGENQRLERMIKIEAGGAGSELPERSEH